MGLTINNTTLMPYVGTMNHVPLLTATVQQVLACDTMQAIWNKYRKSDEQNFISTCAESECLVGFGSLPLIAKYERLSETFCAVSLTSFDRKTVQGHIQMHEGTVHVEMNKGEISCKAKSDFANHLEVNLKIPVTTHALISKHNTIEEEEITTIKSLKFKIEKDPANENKISIKLETPQGALSGDCLIGEGTGLTCVIGKDSLFNKILGDKYIAQIEMQEDKYKLDLKKQTSRSQESQDLGSLEFMMNKETGEFSLSGRIDSLIPGDLPFFDGNFKCLNNPHATCEADLKISSFELNEAPTHLKAGYSRDQNNLKAHITINEKELFKANMSSNNETSIFNAYAQMNDMGFEGSLKLKNLQPTITKSQMSANSSQTLKKE